MSLLEIIALLAVIILLGLMVWATSRAAAHRRDQRDSVDSGSSWNADFGDGGGD